LQQTRPPRKQDASHDQDVPVRVLVFFIRPKLITCANCDRFEIDAVIEAFGEGITEHEEGSKVWDECFDGSV
jgi:hypothetical protein